MLFMWFALVLQVSVLLELCLNRIICIALNTKRSSVRRMADANFVSQTVNLLVSILLLPVTWAGVCVQVLLGQVFFCLSLLVVIGVFAVINQSSSNLLTLLVNVYNSGVGEIMNTVVIAFLELFAPVFRVFLPIWNSIVYMGIVLIRNVFLPFVFVNSSTIPDLLLNLTTLVSTLAVSLADYVTSLLQCVQYIPGVENATSPFWVNDMACVATPYTLSLDLMTPGVFAGRTATNIRTMFISSCGPATNVLTVLFYPLVDYNFYKMVHGAVNLVLHVCLSLPVWTANRCAYAERTVERDYTALEKKIMCIPDVSHAFSILTGTLRAFGALVDNFLDISFAVVYSAVSGQAVDECSDLSLQSIWQDASDVFGTRQLQVVGMTRSLYAVTDGDSVLYHSMSGSNTRSSYALHTWPFQINLDFGVAAVRYSEASDFDDEGGGRTGLLGCQCQDAADGIVIVCASVPYQKHLAEDDADNAAFTTHRVRFLPDSARAGLSCSSIVVRVSSMRFSRKRFSSASSGDGAERSFNDPYKLTQANGDREATSRTADAAIIVMPLCAVRDSVTCLPTLANCFPFCMALHAAGQSTQTLTMHNAQSFTEWTSIGQTDCVVSEAESAVCSDQQRMAVNDENGIAMAGCGATRCAPDADTVTFMQNAALGVSNRSISAWNAHAAALGTSERTSSWKGKQGLTYVRSERQPFVFAGDMFLYSKEEDLLERSGVIRTVRLFDNKRGDFSMQQEELSLVASDLQLQYAECDDEACYQRQLADNKVVLPLQVTSQPVYVSAVSEWAVHWVSTPDLGNCAIFFEVCAGRAAGGLSVEDQLARLWSVYTVRNTNDLGEVFTESRTTSYMVIPNFFKCSQSNQCNSVVNMKVTGLEYMNEENLLLTVLATSAENWDWEANDVMDGRDFEYRYYFVHPNRHDCTTDGSVEARYTCWREESAGMFRSAELSLSALGSLCPALQRMPKWGSMASEMGIASAALLEVLIETVFTLPAALTVPDGLSEVFQVRASPTFHRFLDMRGASLLDLDPCFRAAEQAAFHLANTLTRAAKIFEGRPGGEVIEPILIGTARVFQYTSGLTMVENRVLGPLASSFVFDKFITAMSKNTQSAPVTPFASQGASSANYLQMFTSIFSGATSWAKVTMKAAKKMAVKTLMKKGARQIGNSVMTVAYELKGDMRRSVFDSMRFVCDGFGQIIGRTNAWGQLARHSCMLGPDSMEAFMQTLFIIILEYPVMDCVCKQVAGLQTEEAIERICMPQGMSVKQKSFVMQTARDARDQQPSQCFGVMDAANDNLLKAMDPVLSRMHKAVMALQNAFASILSGAGSTSCSDWEASPFVVSLLPEPVDYFMGCMHTIDCRSRCLDNILAFEEALADYRVTGAQDLALTKPFEVDTESRFFSANEEFEGKHLAPFVIYAVMPLQDSVCDAICSGSARCVSIAGMDASVADHPQGQLKVDYYCVPVSVLDSVYRADTSVNTSEYGSFGAALVTTMHVATRHKVTAGQGEWLVLVTRGIETGLATVWMLPGASDVALELLQTKSFDLDSYSDTEDVNDRRWSAQRVNGVFVLPAHSNSSWCTVFMSLSQTTPAGFVEGVCVYTHVDTAVEGALYDNVLHSCSAGEHAVIFPPKHHLVCLDLDCKRAVRLPHTEAALELVEFGGYQPAEADSPADFDWTFRVSQTAPTSSQQRTVVGAYNAEMLTLLQNNKVQLTRRQLSSVGYVTKNTSTGVYVDICMTGRGEAMETWLQNVRVVLPTTGAAQVAVSSSFATRQNVQLVVNCSVSTCVGCQGTGPRETDIQHKCFAAAVCAIGRCVGSTVNMNRPLCQIGALIGTLADEYRVLLAAFWTFFANNVIFVVELSANRRQKYEIAWPAEIKQMYTCRMKDIIIQFWSLFGALMVNVATAFQKAQSRGALAQSYADTTMQLSSEARTQAMTTISTTAFVELMVQFNLAVVYAPIVVWKMMQCKLDSAFGVLSSGADSTFKMGSAEFDKADEAAVGVCLGEKVKQALADMSDTNTNEALKSDVSSLISNLSSMITGQMLGNFAFVYDAFFAWAGGVCSGAMNVVQVLDWTRCKLPVIDNAVVSSCVCGDRPARIPDAQRRAKQTTDSLWCYGLLMLSDVEGGDQLIWNPYSLHELLQLGRGAQNLQQYLDCISMNRCSFESLIDASVGSIADYVECVQSDASCAQFAAYTRCVDEHVDCNALKPTDAVFDAQGVEVMQVVTRCRNNYQQKRWDQAAPLLGMLEVAAWTTDPVSEGRKMAFESQSDSLSKERKRFSTLAQFMRPFSSLDEGTWSCLNTSLANAQYSNNCAELGLANNIFADAQSLLTYFEYEITAVASTFENMDACESFSGRITDRNEDNVVYPKIVWDGDSVNAVPVAELHYTKMYDRGMRISIAERELDNLITHDIKPLFLTLTTRALEEIATTYWSFDGDFVHQLVDCVMLGPFAAADMLPAFTTATARQFPVPQYHRGSAHSRQIHFANKTAGSDVRRQIMAKVIAHIGTVKDGIIMQHVTAAVSQLQEAYSAKANLYCRCFDGSKSLECCLVSHEDLSTFTHTFAAQYVLQKVEDLKEEIEGSFARSIFSSTILTEDIWANESFAYTLDFDEADREALGEAYFFDYSRPVYHYAPSEVALRMQDTVWTQCTRALRAAFSTLPLLKRGDDVLEVDADTIFDPNAFVQGGGERYLHATEGVIERILAKARRHSPVFWSHVHRYVPSDSVWCEDSSADAGGGAQTARVPEDWHDMVFTQDSIHAPHAAEVLYVAHVAKACPCAWRNGTMCLVPLDVCNSVYAAQDPNRWAALCSAGVYNSSADIMFVRSVLEEAGASLPSCREYQPSTVWGLLDSAQQHSWYSGRREQWNVSLQEVATLGPGGVRLSDLLAPSPRDFDAEMFLRIQRHKDHGIWNSQFGHTIAQPVCNGTFAASLRQNLSEYFTDVLFPMAHSVHEAPSQAICGRWVTEYALYAFLSNVSGPADPDVEVQRLSEELWRRRCLLQLEQIGICNLRNVFQIAPSTHQSDAHCPFSVVPQHNCDPFYVTDACLVMCDGVFYDPCMCTDEPDCAFMFSPHACASGVILMPPSTSLDMASLHWPTLAWPDKASQELLDRVHANQSVHGIPFVLDDEMVEYVLAQAGKAEGGTPDAFCDDTLDYLHPEARHPVGYHPTCACTRARTNMRGFTSWMSAGDEHAWSIDPVRVRNMTQFSSAFGSSHLVCDAAVYGAGYAMNGLQMQSKWNPNVRADPAVPIAADYASEASMSEVGGMSGDAWDTPHVPAPQSDAMFAHSVGIVRDWLRYHSDEDGAADIQSALDEIWPHWLPASVDTYGAKPGKPMEAGCSFPALFRCARGSDCGESLSCKYYDTDDTPLGICVHADTCFRHDHCEGGKLCSGEGVCVLPELVMRNTLDVEVDAHVFAKQAKQCARSSFGMSKEQRVPSFARDNGLCGVRNLFTYKDVLNVSADLREPADTAVRHVPDKRVLRTTQRVDGLLTDGSDGFLRSQASACDRNYEHTDYAMCTPCAENVLCTASTVCMCTDSFSQRVQGVNTWEENAAGGVDVRFCDFTSTRGDLANLVSPYVHIDAQDMLPEDTLKESRTDIKRCLDFDICPTPSFTIRGQSVAQRVVLLTDSVRAFALEDTRLCFAFGLWDGETELCTLDRLVVPLFEAVYTDAGTSTSLETSLKALRGHCEDAFGTDYDSALNEFETVYNELRTPYAPSASADIQATVNTLLLKVFNIQPTSLRNRGIDSMQQYSQKARCVRHVYERLQAVRVSNTEKLEAQAVSEEDTPGSTLYLFHPHAPIEVPLLWFWKCVIVARDTADEGGAPLQWLRMMTADLDVAVPCVNVDADSRQNSTLLRHLQLQPDIYVSSVEARTNIDIFIDMLGALEMSFAFWNIEPLPSIHCFATPDDEHAESCTALQYNKSCERVFAPPMTVVPQKEDVLNSMYDLALQFLFKRSRPELEALNALTLKTLLGWGLAAERALASDLDESTDYSNAIPVYELTALSQDLDDLPGSQDPRVFRLQNTHAANCVSSEPLEFAEYQIASSVCASSGAGEIPLPNDKLRVQMYRRVHSIMGTKTSDPEVITCFDTNEKKYQAISQKQALLLMLHYLKYAIHSTRDSKFGMLTYEQDVRLFMQRDVPLARGVAQVAAKASRYQMHIVAKNFICSETEMFPDPVPVSPLQSALRNCLRDLKRDIGWKVAKGDDLVLQPASDVFLGGFYTSFAVSATEDAFVDRLVNTDWQDAKHVYGRNELCFKTSTGAAYLRPLWTGDLDLQSCPFGAACGCETSREGAVSFFDVSCDSSSSMESCKEDFPAFYSTVTARMYEDCHLQQNKPVTLAQYEQMRDGNLCLQAPGDGSVCPRQFGAHGRVRGRATGDLHAREDVQQVQSGLFEAGSSIFQSLTSAAENVTAIRLLGTDIGGHSIAFSVYTLGRRSSGTQQVVLDLTCVSAGRSCSDTQMRRWLSQARETWRLQHLRFLARTIPSAQAGTHWTCPLQWLSMYGDNRTLYAARSPNANRNRARFEHLTGDSFYAHATVSTALKAAQHPARFMSDASACVDGELQGGAVAYACKGGALLRAATQMHRKGWRAAAFHTASAPCGRILDWPHRAFKTADGLDGGDTGEPAQYCNVFDRLPSFAVRYVAVGLDAIQERMRLPSTAPGGACHMGALKRLPKNGTADSVQFCTAFPAHSRCRMLSVAAQEDATLLVSTYETDIPAQAPYVARKAATRPVRHCKLCEDHATASFVDRFQRERPLERGPVQLSVGLPVRLATERVLAAEIRARLCPGSRHRCDKMDALVQQKPHIWQKGSLMPELTRMAQEHHHAAAPVVHDEALWTEPWVFCRNQPDRCAGVIDKRTWQDPATRFGACSALIAAHSQQNSTPTRFCTLSPQLANICVKLARWSVEDVPFILCKAAGHPQCLSQSFFYNPTAFSISNKDFVYNSVRAMYTKLNASACPAVAANRQVLQNEVLRAQCGSVALEPVQRILSLARSFGFDFSVIQYCIVSAGMNLVGIVLGSFANMKSLVSESTYNMQLYIRLLINKLKDVMTVIWKVLFTLADYDAFKWIKTVVRIFCAILEFVIAPIIKKALLPFWNILLTVFKEMRKLPLMGAIFDPVIAVLTAAVNAANDFPDSCPAEDSGDDETRARGSLPAATKCWSTYSTFFGDNNVLSCTKADTCHRGVTDTSLVMCGECAEPATDFAPFGCLSVTKTCTCSVPLFSMQYCESNSDCYAEESSCKYLDNELEPSIGFTRCSSCQHKRLCFVGVGSTAGYCACTLFDVQWGRCLDQGAAVSPGYDNICVLTPDYNSLQSTFAFSFDVSMSTPCRLLNQGFTFCSRESSNGFLYVTGTEVARRRRLLEFAPGDSGAAAIDTMSGVCRDALSTDLMPNVRRECVDAFEESKVTVRMLGMEDAWPACAFCGVEDMLHNFMFKPHNMIILFSNASSVARVFMRHTYARHVITACTTWRTMASVVVLDLQGAAGHNGTHVLLLRVLNLSLVVSVDENASEPVQFYAPQRRLLTSQDRVTEAIARAGVMHKKFLQEASVYFSFTFEASSQQSEWMSTWPPRVSTQVLSDGTCTPAVNVIKAMGWTFGNLTASYAAETRQEVSSSISSAWILVAGAIDTGIPWDAVADKYDVVTRAALWLVDYLLGLVGLHRRDIYDAMAAAIAEIPHVVRCDIKAVQTCYKWKKHALHVMAILAVYFLAVYVVSVALGFGGPVLLLLAVFPYAVMYMTYGVSPFCSPMVPVCIYDDFLWTARLLLPVHVELPLVMYKNMSCLPVRGAPIQADCLRTCEDDAFGYGQWYTVFAWWGVEFNVHEFLLRVVGGVPRVLVSEDDYDALTAQVALKARAMLDADEGLVLVNRVCAFVGLYMALPYLFIFILLIFIACSLLQTAVLLACSVLSITFNLLLSGLF